MSNACSPLFSHFSTTLQGITSIRAYGAEQQFQDELLKRIDNYMRAARTCHNLNVSCLPCNCRYRAELKRNVVLDRHPYEHAGRYICRWIGVIHSLFPRLCGRQRRWFLAQYGCHVL